MPIYRIFEIDLSGRIQGPGHIVTNENDSSALLSASGMVAPDLGAEVWQGKRLVCRLPRVKTGMAQEHQAASSDPPQSDRRSRVDAPGQVS